MEEQDNSPVFELNEQTKLDIRQVSDTGVNNCDEINEMLKRCEVEAQAYLKDLAKLKYKQQQALVDEYAAKYFKVKLEYDEFMENNNENDLKIDLEKEKNAVMTERADLLQNTYEMSDDFGKMEKETKKTEKDLRELDEEVKFLMEQVEFANDQKMKLEDKIKEIKGGNKVVFIFRCPEFEPQFQGYYGEEYSSYVVLGTSWKIELGT